MRKLDTPILNKLPWPYGHSPRSSAHTSRPIPWWCLLIFRPAATIHKSDLSGRMARWAMELSEYGIQYKPRLSKKGQVLDDFLVEISQTNTCPNEMGWWILCVDGASRQSGAGIGLQLTSPIGERIEQAVFLGFSASNNKSKYEAMMVGLHSLWLWVPTAF